jgi:hypothetical protein
MSVIYNGETLIGEQVSRALAAAHLLDEFEKKHREFIETNPPSLAAALKTPWVSWDAKFAAKVAEYFGNGGWSVNGDSREKIVEGVAVAVHGLSDKTVRVPLVATSTHLDCTSVTAGVAGKIGTQSIHSLN